jgi:hypothetical protein
MSASTTVESIRAARAAEASSRWALAITTLVINRRQAAYALLDLDSRSTRFIAASLLETVAVSIGVNRTPGGLQIAA